jgi:hypothetical protein
MRKQATHKGECQICGRTQKVPGGRMAKHGYTVSWGFFAGICQGSDALPFEQDCSLVAEAIRGAKAHRDYLVQRITELKADTSPAKAHAQYYVPHHGYSSTWVDTNTIVAAEPGGRHSGQWVAPVTDDKRGAYEASLGYKARTYGSATAVEAAYKANTRLAEDMERKDLASATQYIDWQTSRLAGWTVQPLRTVRR